MLCGGLCEYSRGVVGVEGETGDIWLFGIKETKVLRKMSTSPPCSNPPDR